MLHLAAVAGSHASARDVEERVGFCSYCGRFGGGQRVCPSCGLGVLLETDATALRNPGAAFVIARADGRISAVSQAAEKMLGKQDSLIGRPLLALINGQDLARFVATAGAGHGGPFRLEVTQIGGGTLRAVVATCTNPRAALVVLTRP
jgi:PAS domain-containing protein